MTRKEMLISMIKGDIYYHKEQKYEIYYDESNIISPFRIQYFSFENSNSLDNFNILRDKNIIKKVEWWEDLKVPVLCYSNESDFPILIKDRHNGMFMDTDDNLYDDDVRPLTKEEVLKYVLGEL